MSACLLCSHLPQSRLGRSGPRSPVPQHSAMLTAKAKRLKLALVIAGIHSPRSVVRSCPTAIQSDFLESLMTSKPGGLHSITSATSSWRSITTVTSERTRGKADESTESVLIHLGRRRSPERRLQAVRIWQGDLAFHSPETLSRQFTPASRQVHSAVGAALNLMRCPSRLEIGGDKSGKPI